MSRNERIIVDRMDRRRERTETRDERTARRAALQARADSFIACQIGELPECDRADFTECMTASLRRHLVAHHGEPSAASILSREAYEAGRNILPRKIARAEAERLFTQAANDGGAA